MKLSRKLWFLWIVSTLSGGGILAAAILFGGSTRANLLIGKTTSGHHQIELACDACHTSAFGGDAEIQDACVGCHAQDLKSAKDSHPARKFRDPRNADLLMELDATKCVACHTEHRPEITNAMGVTLPNDYCALCHSDVGENRPSHKDLEFTTCADAGCHNFHDNRALYEDFLERHAGKPEIAPEPYVRHRLNVERPEPELPPITVAENADAPVTERGDPSIGVDWLATAHAKAGVNCSGCHAQGAGSPEEIAASWVQRPDHKACADCHALEVGTFTQGRHGMRLAEGLKSETAGLLGLFKDKPLGPMRPELARLPMSPKVAETEIGCVTCHSAHAFNVKKAEVEVCLTCHEDEHSKAYIGSPHHRLSVEERAGTGAKASGVTCATCHLPRFMHEDEDSGEETLVVNHNQNDNLRPNEKMLRSVCMDCHGLGFAIDALADRGLIRRNFTGRPSGHVESIDWVIRRLKKREPG